MREGAHPITFCNSVDTLMNVLCSSIIRGAIGLAVEALAPSYLQHINRYSDYHFVTPVGHSNVINTLMEASKKGSFCVQPDHSSLTSSIRDNPRLYWFPLDAVILVSWR